MRLSFAEADLHSMYYEDGRISNFPCTEATQQEFNHTVNMLRGMPSVDCLRKWRCLEPEFDETTNHVSIKVDRTHRLEAYYNLAHDELTIVCLLKKPSYSALA